MIKINKLSKKYGKSYAIKDVDLTLGKNEVICIIGPSGSGKSTLLRCINYLEVPTSGQIWIDGSQLTKANHKKLLLKIGMVFQQFHLFPHMNVIENLIYAPTMVLKSNKDETIVEAQNLLKTFGLSNKENAKPADLSGGQKQRVAIMRALMMNPEIMMFDEPTSALDIEAVKDVVSAISLLKNKTSMIVVTHHVNFAKAIADKIVFMDSGLVLCNQDCAEFFIKPKSQRARLFLENLELSD